MVDAFISYRRKPSAALARFLQERLKNKYNIICYVDVTDGSNERIQFPEKLMRAIEDAPVFICLLGDTTLDSEWVLKEIRHAYELNKYCIPVFHESFERPENPEAAINHLLDFDGVHVMDVKNIFVDEAVDNIAKLINPRKKFFNLPVFWLAIVGILLCIGLVTWGVNNLIQQASDRVVTGIQTAQVTETEIIPTVDPHQLAIEGVDSNEQWRPVSRRFNDIEMMLVPSGCFMMGSTDEQVEYAVELGGQIDWFNNEQPVEEVCIDAPFWIDKTEVTQADFQRLNGQQLAPSNFEGENRPVDSITRLEAQAFCESRSARLPSESEWEYVARGVDSLIFPWSNEWNPDNVIWNRDSEEGTAIVGSIPEGASWVGALDMSGNVWEWTSSPYEDDPALYTVRGSAWDTTNASFLRGAVRFFVTPELNDNTIGFRCIHDFE